MGYHWVKLVVVVLIVVVLSIKLNNQHSTMAKHTPRWGRNTEYKLTKRGAKFTPSSFKCSASFYSNISSLPVLCSLLFSRYFEQFS